MTLLPCNLLNIPVKVFLQNNVLFYRLQENKILLEDNTNYKTMKFDIEGKLKLYITCFSHSNIKKSSHIYMYITKLTFVYERAS